MGTLTNHRRRLSGQSPNRSHPLQKALPCSCHMTTSPSVPLCSRQWLPFFFGFGRLFRLLPAKAALRHLMLVSEPNEALLFISRRTGMLSFCLPFALCRKCLGSLITSGLECICA